MYCSKCRNDYCESCRGLKQRNNFAHTVALGFLYLIAVLCDLQCHRTRREKEALEHHAAHYDERTGQFLWNDEPELPK